MTDPIRMASAADLSCLTNGFLLSVLIVPRPKSFVFTIVMLFWDPLMRTSILGLIGRIEDSVQAGKDLLACKPDFRERGRILIRNYVKFEDIEAKVIEGLGLAGIDIV